MDDDPLFKQFPKQMLEKMKQLAESKIDYQKVNRDLKQLAKTQNKKYKKYLMDKSIKLQNAERRIFRKHGVDARGKLNWNNLKNESYQTNKTMKHQNLWTSTM